MNIGTVTVQVVFEGDSTGTDDMGQPVKSQGEPETVSNVVYDPSATSDLADSMRTSGVIVNAVFHFPKTCTKSLRGARISYAGHDYAVIGDPQPYTASNVPGRWNREADCKEVEG